VIVAGDLNTFKGGDELKPFLRATGLVSANDQNTPSWPSWNPVHELDFILYGDGIDANHFEVRHSPLSDHLPLVFDFSVR
jgi:endonuclease/exonuclease/phosphatase family metal-dependent hydrolase